jgi:hypothetical protein
MALPLIAGVLAAARAGLSVAKEPLIRSGLITGALGVPLANYMGDWAPPWAVPNKARDRTQDIKGGGPLSNDPWAGTIFSKEAVENRAEWNNADEFPNDYKMAAPQEYIPSHEIPGYDAMVNAGYDSWSPSDGYAPDADIDISDFARWALEQGETSLPYMTGIAAEERPLGREYDIMEAGMNYPVDNRSDWQKWKDSASGGRR